MADLPPSPRRYENGRTRNRRSLNGVARVLVIVAIVGAPFVAIHAAGSISAVFGPKEVHVPLMAGITATLPGAGVRITLRTITGNQFLPYAGGAPIKQWYAEVTIENTSDHTLTLASWRLRGRDRHEYLPVMTTGGNDLPDHAILRPAQSLSGTVTFSVPQDVTARWLRYGAHGLLSSDLYFDTP